MQLHEDYIENLDQDAIKQEDVKAEKKNEYRFIIELKDQTFYEHEFNELLRRLGMVMRRQPEVDTYGVITREDSFTFKYGFNSNFSSISSAYQFIRAICVAINTSIQDHTKNCIFLYDNDEEFPYKSEASYPKMILQLFEFSQYIVKEAAQNAYTWIWNVLKQLTSRKAKKCQEFVLKATGALNYISLELGKSFTLSSTSKDVDTFSVKQLNGVKLDISALMAFDVPGEVKWMLMDAGGNTAIRCAYDHYPLQKVITPDYTQQITQQLWTQQPTVCVPKIFVSGEGKPDQRKYVFCCYAGMIESYRDNPRAIFIVIETTYQSKLKKLPTQQDFFRTLNVLLSGQLTQEVMKDVIYATRNAKKMNEDFIDNIDGEEIISTQKLSDEKHEHLDVSIMFEIYATHDDFIHRRADIEKRVSRYMQALPEITEFDIFYTGNPYFKNKIDPDLLPFFREDENINALDGFMICFTFDVEFKNIKRALNFILDLYNNIGKQSMRKGWITNKKFPKWRVVDKEYVEALMSSRSFSLDLPNSGTQMMAYKMMTDVLDMLTGNQLRVQDYMMNTIVDASGPIIKFEMDEVDRLTPGNHNQAKTIYLGSHLAKYIGDEETYFKEMKKFKFTKSAICEFVSDNRTKLYVGKYAWPDSINRKEIMDMSLWSDFDLCNDNWAYKVLQPAREKFNTLAADFRMKVQGNDSFLCFLCILNCFEDDDKLYFIPMAIQQKISGQRGIAAAAKNMSKAIRKLSGQDMGFDEALLKTMEALY